MDGYGVFVIDEYSCDRPWLVVEHRESRVILEREAVVVVKLAMSFPRS